MHCQKCRQPLKLDGSLEDLNPAAYDLLVSSSTSPSPPKLDKTSPSQPQDQARRELYDKVSRNAGPPSFKRYHGGHPRDTAMSFVYLTESQVGGPQQQPPTPKRRSRDAPTTPTRSSRSKSGPNSILTNPKTTTTTTTSPMADEMERMNRLFEILSARSDIDHPVCVECTDLLVEGLQKKLDAASRERDAYVKHLRQAQASKPSPDDIKAQNAALAKAQAEKVTAMEELENLEKEKEAVDLEILALDEESKRLDEEEEAFWRERNAFALTMADFRAERDSVNAKFSHDAQLLEKLRRSNIFNDTFCISYDGDYATINGLRLGRLSVNPVSWAEINAAWGHALMLLVTVADRLGCRFQGLDPQPMGSTSRIIRYETPIATSLDTLASSSNNNNTNNKSHLTGPPPKRHVLELYTSGDMPLGLTFMHRRFDNAMVAFLELVRQLGDFVHAQTEQDQQQQHQKPSSVSSAPGAVAGGDTVAGASVGEREGSKPLTLPYPIKGDIISKVSIRLAVANDEEWTKACKYTLTSCKFLLAHASNVTSNAAAAAAVTATGS